MIKNIMRLMNEKVNQYIDKQKSPQKEICQKLRELIFDTLPEIKEEMKWGVPAYDDGKYYFVVLKDHVNLGLSVFGLSKEEAGLFEGAGKLMRHIKIAKLKDIDSKKLAKLLKMVYRKASCASC